MLCKRMIISNAALYLSTYLSIYDSIALCWTLASFRFLKLFTQSVELLVRAISRWQGSYLHTEQHRHRINAHTDIRVSSGIRIHDPRVRASKGSSCLSQRGHKLCCYTMVNTIHTIVTDGPDMLVYNRIQNGCLVSVAIACT
jgi:hypothetical protein